MSSDVVVSWQEEPGVGRAFLVGCAVGTAVSFAGMTAAGVVGGLGLGASVGLAAFVAFWGGLGFGGMLGGVVGIIRVQADEARGAAAELGPIPLGPTTRTDPGRRSVAGAATPVGSEDRPAALSAG